MERANTFRQIIVCLAQLTLSDEHYTYVAPNMTAPFSARVATPARDLQARIVSMTIMPGTSLQRTPEHEGLRAVQAHPNDRGLAACAGGLLQMQ